METNIRFTSFIAQLLVEREMILPNVIQKMKTLFMLIFFFFEIRAFCEIMWSNIADRGRTHMTI